MQSWRVIGASVEGSGHRKTGRGCDDAHDFRVRNDGSLIMAVADGAGSAVHAARAADAAIQATISSLDRRLSTGETPTSGRDWAHLISATLQDARRAIEQMALSDRAAVEQTGRDAAPLTYPQSAYLPPALTGQPDAPGPGDPLPDQPSSVSPSPQRPPAPLSWPPKATPAAGESHNPGEQAATSTARLLGTRPQRDTEPEQHDGPSSNEDVTRPTWRPTKDTPRRPAGNDMADPPHGPQGAPGRAGAPPESGREGPVEDEAGGMQGATAPQAPEGQVANRKLLRDYATTLLVCVVGQDDVAVGQVGDGAVVALDTAGNLHALTAPDHGEYINEAVFLIDTDYLERAQIGVYSLDHVSGLALMTDGLQMLALSYPHNEPFGPFFQPLFGFASEADATKQELEAFLDSDRVNERTDDDKTLLLAVRSKS